MRPPALALAAALAGAAGPAFAGPAITLNGVPIDGATGQRFEGATVVIDDRGDVHIEARGYAARPAGDPAPRSAPVAAVGAAAAVAAASAPARLSHRYFLVTEHAQPGARYDLAVFVNAQWIREVKAGEPQVVMELTRWLNPGPNRLVLAATRRAGGPPAPSPAALALKAVVGEGTVGGGRVVIDNPLVELTRTAGETEDRTEEFVVEAR
ncbi:hypothetical protein ACOQFB_14665 [Anaeromyxobacter sp. Red801]|uniref:hypothetical protein n=1 Tax=Anaeromyxobacter sp. Red801 TaxID=3411632 RepID=UPI003BA124B2